jgi:transposase
MSPPHYPSDLSDQEWAILEPLLSSAEKRGRPPKWPHRHVADAVFYLLRSGCSWRMLPREYPPWQTVYYHFRKWRIDGRLHRAHDRLREAVRYYAQGAGYGFFFTKKGATLSFVEGKGRGHALALSFLGANPQATLEVRQRLSGEVNYLVGDDPTNWQQGLATHGELLYGGLWPGIDMAVRGEGGNLKYEFHLQPGSSVEDVRLGYRGAEGLKVGAGGELLVQTSLGILKYAAPVSYQRIGGERVPVKSRYTLTGDGGYGFAVGAYDPRYPLVIDPGLDYSTFLGGVGTDIGEAIAVDGRGRAYVTGFTFSADYPTTAGAFDTTFNGGLVDAFVTKLPIG